MKYKKGDKFIFEIESIDHDPEYRYCPYRIKDMSGQVTEDWFGFNQPYEPPTWRDGAVKKPKIGEEVRYMYKPGSPHHPTIHTGEVHEHENFTDYYWLYSDEFPMPKEPDPEIANCPCGGVTFTTTEMFNDEMITVVYCSDCYYRNELEAHNEFAHRGNDERQV